MNASTKFHRDQTVTVWDVYCQTWRRMSAVRLFENDSLMATLSTQERLRIARVAAKTGSRSAAEWLSP